MHDGRTVTGAPLFTTNAVSTSDHTWFGRHRDRILTGIAEGTITACEHLDPAAPGSFIADVSGTSAWCTRCPATPPLTPLTERRCDFCRDQMPTGWMTTSGRISGTHEPVVLIAGICGACETSRVLGPVS
jgi:hypothetical protein